MTAAEARQRAMVAAAHAACAYQANHMWEYGPTHEVSRTEAAIQAWEAALWQPIETAPRDGTRALFFAPPAGVEWPNSAIRTDLWRNDAWWQMRPGQPYTHWRPFPAGPGGGA
jgi:hypothetical protein